MMDNMKRFSVMGVPPTAITHVQPFPMNIMAGGLPVVAAIPFNPVRDQHLQEIAPGLEVVGGGELAPAAPIAPAPAPTAQPLQPVKANVPKGTKRKKGTKPSPAKLSDYELKRKKQMEENHDQLVHLGLAQACFANCELAKTFSLLDYNLERFVEGQRVSVHYNDEFGWLAGTIYVLNYRKKNWVIFDGETKDYGFSMTEMDYGKKWCFVDGPPAPLLAEE